jgi:hypothetical protein
MAQQLWVTFSGADDCIRKETMSDPEWSHILNDIEGLRFAIHHLYNPHREDIDRIYVGDPEGRICLSVAVDALAMAVAQLPQERNSCIGSARLRHLLDALHILDRHLERQRQVLTALMRSQTFERVAERTLSRLGDLVPRLASIAASVSRLERHKLCSTEVDRRERLPSRRAGSTR